MTSCGPDGQPSLYTHMWSFPDYRQQGNNSQSSQPALAPCFSPGSLYAYFYGNPSFSKFRTIIDRAQMIGQLGGPQANFTILAPKDESLTQIPIEYFTKMDNGLAKQILDASIIHRPQNRKILTSSPVSYYATKNPEMRMYITNIGTKSGMVTRVNNCASIVEWDIECNNGIIHVVDNIIAPNMDHFMN